MKTINIILLLLIPCLSFSQKNQEIQQNRTLQAFNSQANIKIDGILDESDWSRAEVTNGFSPRNPDPLAPSNEDAEVRILYNDNAIYIGALIKGHPDSISTQLTERDEIYNCDWFGIIFCPYQDGINGVGFIMTTQGVQFDTKYSALGEDTGWDAVWDGEVKIKDEGWYVEMEIPYAALRFPDTEVQTWDINFVKQIMRKQETSFWYPVDQTIAGFLNQTGQLEGIKNIKPPLRLQATPFIAGYVENLREGSAEVNPESSWGRSFNAGMDIKYGLSDAFTLDMTLIPDFGEAQSDNQVLNLSPFEVQFNENRQFFTEGTELFNKGDIFYSRRIGGSPLYSAGEYLQAGEEVIQQPQITQLFNATKISGRTNRGTGIGFFNAVSGKTLATVGTDLQTRDVEVSPLTNYNVMVVDQNLRNNSYVSLINTNVLRAGDDYDANVSGLVFDLRNKDQSYNVEGSYVLSQKIFSSHDRFTKHLSGINFIVDKEKQRLIDKNINTIRGHRLSIGAGKISGNFNYGFDYQEESHTLDINDLGFQRAPNEREVELYFSYTKFEPFGKFNSMGAGMDVENSWLYNPSDFVSSRVSAYWFATTKKFWDFNLWGFYQPTTEKQYYEPRRAGRYFLKPQKSIIGFNMSTDNRKKVILRSNGYYGGTYDFWDANWAGLGLGATFNLTDRFSLFLYGESSFDNNDHGFVNNFGPSDEDIILGRRRILKVENEGNATYTFNKNMSVNIRLRHFWSSVLYSDYFKLEENGRLGATDYEEFHDLSLNFFNIDMVYRWRFAPGSDIFFIWKNSISDGSNDPDVIQYNYQTALNNLGNFPERNSISLKLVYFLDYAAIINK